MLHNSPPAKHCWKKSSFVLNFLSLHNLKREAIFFMSSQNKKMKKSIFQKKTFHSIFLPCFSSLVNLGLGASEEEKLERFLSEADNLITLTNNFSKEGKMLSEPKMSMKLLMIGAVLLIAAVKGESPTKKSRTGLLIM